MAAVEQVQTRQECVRADSDNELEHGAKGAIFIQYVYARARNAVLERGKNEINVRIHRAQTYKLTSEIEATRASVDSRQLHYGERNATYHYMRNDNF